MTVASVMEYRARGRLAPEAMEERWQQLGQDADYHLLVTGEVRVYKPDGKLLLHYLPAAFSPERMGEFYGTLHELRKLETGNRGYASATPSLPAFEGSTRFRSVPVASAIIGSYEAAPPKLYCRLTAWSGKELDKYSSLFPLFQDISALFEKNVGDRFAAQMEYIRRTSADWVIAGTPFTTITVNNSYPTGYHTDKGDLNEGFSCLTVLRKGNYSGGRLVFPEYQVAVDFQNGDQLLMDAHAAHGNTQMTCGDCGHPMGPGAGDWSHEKAGCTAERISIVCYYRTKMEKCGTAEEEAIRADQWSERRAEINESRLVEDLAVESAGG